MSVVIHPSVNDTLRHLSGDMPQSLLLTGEPGVGLATIAKSLSQKALTAFIEPETSKGETDHTTGMIKIERIRELYEQTRTKQASRRIIILDDADRMSRGAQAAFLKLLEEPNESTHFILTSHAPQLLLPTIRSRVQAVHIRRATAEQTNGFIAKQGITDKTKLKQLDFLASGLPAELYRLITNEAHFRRRADIMSDARDLLTAPAYQKLLIVQKYHSDRSAALQLLDGGLTITRRSLSQKPQAALLQRLERLHDVRDRIATNQNIRLQLCAYVLS